MLPLSAPDLINGAFETLGGASVWLNVRTILRDKKTRGVSPVATAFFTAWGFWNLFYYTHLAQWASFVGGLIIVLGNAAWLTLMFKYRKA
jgi:hypothetical protein